MIQPRVTINGMTKRAICYVGKKANIRQQTSHHREDVARKKGVRGTTRTMLEPTATPRESVSLSLTDTVTAVTCSVVRSVQFRVDGVER